MILVGYSDPAAERFGFRFGVLMFATLALAFFYLSGRLASFPRTPWHDGVSVAALGAAWGLLFLWEPLGRAFPWTMDAIATLLDLSLIAGGIGFFAREYGLIWGR